VGKGKAGRCLARTKAYVSIRQHKSAYVSIRQHTSANGQQGATLLAQNSQVSEPAEQARSIAQQHVVATPPRLRLCIRQQMSAYVCIRQHTSAYVSIRQHQPRVRAQPVFVVPQHTSAYVSIRQHTSAPLNISRQFAHSPSLSSGKPPVPPRGIEPLALSTSGLHTSAYVSIRQHMSAYGIEPLALSTSGLHTSAHVSIRQHTSGHVSMRHRAVGSLYISISEISATSSAFSISICTLVLISK
jgi:hypothetical protein